MGIKFEIDENVDNGLSIGLVVLRTDLTMENEFRRLFAGLPIRIYHCRIKNDAIVNRETLAQMALDLPDAVSLLPNDIQLNAIGYGCTSGATVIGQSKISNIITNIFPESKVTDPITAVIAACHELEIEKLAMLTPYAEPVSLAMQKLLEDNGIKITGFASFEQEEDAVVARVSEASTLDALVSLAKQNQCDGLFASCTNLQTFGILQKAEAIIGKPVISSNQALAWHLNRLSRLNHSFAGYGRLLMG